MSKRITWLLIAAGVLAAVAIIFKGSTLGTQALWDLSRQGTWLLPLVGVSALLDSINPCAFSVLLLTIAFLFSINAVRQRILVVGGVYIAGIFLVYLLIGLGILQALHLFNTPHFMAKVGSTLIIALGAINLLRELFPRFPIHLKIPTVAHQRLAALMHRATIPAAFILGLLVGLCEFPCTGGPYLMVLGLLHDRTTFSQGLGYLILYNLLFILPLAILLLLGSDHGLLGKVQEWRKTNARGMRLYGGLAMIALGIIIFLF